MKFSKLGSSLILGSFVALSFLPLANQPADAALNCKKVEAFGNKQNVKVTKGLNNIYAGKRYGLKLGRRLQLRKVSNVKFNKCRINFKASAALKRGKLFRTKRGFVTVVANVTSFSPRKKEICYRDARITNVKLSKVGGNIETIIKTHANKKSLPDQACISLKK